MFAHGWLADLWKVGHDFTCAQRPLCAQQVQHEATVGVGDGVIWSMVWVHIHLFVESKGRDI
jgi:hypothetical protein